MHDEELAIVRDVLCAHLPKGARAYAFGSRVHGNARRLSNLDLAVVEPAFRARIASDCVPLDV